MLDAVVSTAPFLRARWRWRSPIPRRPPPPPPPPAAGLATEIGPLVQRLVRNLLKRVHGVQAQAGYAKMQSQQQQQ
jgi:hypothetical protein